VKAPVINAVLLLSSIAFFSCGNDPQKIKEITEQAEIPTEITYDAEIFYSDSAIIRVRIKTKEIIRRDVGEQPELEFPQGLHLTFYDSTGAVESTLLSDYAIHYPEKKKVIVKNNVEIVNNRGEKLNTEYLEWLRDEKKIYTEEFVKISTPDEIIFGDGLESNEQFTRYRIKNIKGTIAVRDEEEKEE
jgi:LPS export ABC transporter protein LptC